MGRGLYGQSEGNERNPNGFAEHLADSATVQEREISVIRRMVQEKKYTDINNYVSKLRSKGWSQTQVNSILTKAMHGIKI